MTTPLVLRLLIEGSPAGAVKALGQVQAETRKTGQALSKMDVAGAGFEKTRAGLGALAASLRGLASLAARAFQFAGVGGALSAAGLVAMARNVANAADEMRRLAALANTTTEVFSALSFGAERHGISAEKLADIYKDVQDKIGDFLQTGAGPMADFFENIAPRVGVTAEQFRKLSGPDALQLYYNSLQQANLSQSEMTFYLEALASDSALLAPLLKDNGAAFKDSADQAARLGAVIGTDLAEASKEFNDNLAMMQALMGGVSISIAQEVLPALNRLLERILDAQKAGTWLTPDQLFGATGDLDKKIADVEKKLAALRAGDRFGAGIIKGLIGDPEEEAEKLQNLLAWLEKQRERQAAAAEGRLTTEEKQTAEQNQQSAAVERQTVLIRQQHEQVKKFQAEQIAGAERLRDALRNAWQASVDGARAAQKEAENLLQKASDTSQSTRDKAAARRAEGLPAGQQQAAIAQQADSAVRDASFSALRAKVAAMRGDVAEAERLSEKALKDATRAEQFADKMDNKSRSADVLDEIAKIQETAIKAQAQAKQQQAADLEQQAAAQQAKLAEIETKIVELQSKGDIKVNVDAAGAVGAIDGVAAKLAALPENKTITITVNTVNNGGGPVPAAPDAPARAYGGPLPGYAPHDRADNMLYWGTPGEWVIQRPAVRYWGPEFIAAINAMRMPKFAFGGELAGKSMVSRLRVPSIAAPGASQQVPDVFDFGPLGKVRARAVGSTAADVEAVLKRAALQFGRR